MEKRIRNSDNKAARIMQFIIVAISTIARILLSNLLGIWYSSAQIYDDRLMVNYAVIKNHFQSPISLSLVKTISYPVFLDFVHLTGLTYPLFLSLLWVLAAVLAVRLFSLITKNRWVLIIAYLFILYTPSAFDDWLGTRLYRNAIIAPFVSICFSIACRILLNIVGNSGIRAKELIVSLVSLGLLFSFTYYIKEDGIWLLACLVLFTISLILIVLVRWLCRKNKERDWEASARLMAVLLLPLAIFSAGTEIYKSVNRQYFGVAETNTRTEGELGKFVANIYRIKSPNRTVQTWAPYDAIEAAFDASETLKQYPRLEEAILHTPWFSSDIVSDPIPGDFLTWVLRTAMVDIGFWESEEQVSSFFGKVNQELNDAFESGKLQRDDRIQISSQSGGRNLSEMLELKEPILHELDSIVFLKGYVPGGMSVSDNTDPASTECATLLTRINLRPLDSVTFDRSEEAIGNRISSKVFACYSVVNPFMLAVAFIGFILTVVRLIRFRNGSDDCRKTYLPSAIVMFVIAGITLMYCLAIAWFSEVFWIRSGQDDRILAFYSVGAVPLFSLFCLFGFCLFADNIEKILHHDRITATKQAGTI